MTAAVTAYYSFKEYVADGTFDLNADTFKAALVSSAYTFNVEHTTWADASAYEVTNGGYTAGGATLSGVAFGQSSGVATLDASDTEWTAIGGSIVARRVVIYKSGTANGRGNPLILSILMDVTPADVVVVAGKTLRIQYSASGLLSIA